MNNARFFITSCHYSFNHLMAREKRINKPIQKLILKKLFLIVH